MIELMIREGFQGLYKINFFIPKTANCFDFLLKTLENKWWVK